MRTTHLFWLLFILFCISFPTKSWAQYGIGFEERGVASYFTDRFAQRKTASGEQFDNNDLVACHSKIPFNSKVKITNLSNNRSVIVRINDRGPYAYGRIMDISKAAAKEIDLISTGTAKVEIRVVEDPQGNRAVTAKKEEPRKSIEASIENKPRDESRSSSNNTYSLGSFYSQWGTQRYPKGYTVQIGGYSNFKVSQGICKTLRTKGFKDKLFIAPEKHGSSILYKVLVGEFENASEAQALRTRLSASGYANNFHRAFSR